MKHVSAVTLQNALATAGQHVKSNQPIIDSASAQVVNALFRELKAIFPAWRNAWPTTDDEGAAKRSWVKAFTAAGLRSIEQIQHGVEQCRLSGRPFMPSVGEFIQWCQPTPEALGCPAARDAYRMACGLAHPASSREQVPAAVWHAANEVGLYELGSLPEAKSWPMFERAYGLTLGMLVRGQPLREIPKALPESVSVPASPDRVRAALAEMRKKLKGVA